MWKARLLVSLQWVDDHDEIIRNIPSLDEYSFHVYGVIENDKILFRSYESPFVSDFAVFWNPKYRIFYKISLEDIGTHTYELARGFITDDNKKETLSSLPSPLPLFSSFYTCWNWKACRSHLLGEYYLQDMSFEIFIKDWNQFFEHQTHYYMLKQSQKDLTQYNFKWMLLTT